MATASTGNAPVRSMTGFARIRRETSLGELTISLKSVNHRGLDLHFHPNAEFAPFESALRSLIKRHVGRGHLEVRIFLQRQGAPAGGEARSYNPGFIAQYVTAYREAAKAFAVNGDVDLNAILRLPGALSADGPAVEVDESFEPHVMEAVTTCLDELNSFREREGAELRSAMEAERQAIDQNIVEMNGFRQNATQTLLRRLQERLRELLETIDVDSPRLLEEAALLAERSDIAEELVRLQVHTAQLGEILQSGGEIGKKVDFLLQEMNRETNTILSKTSGTGDIGLKLTDRGIETKARIEKIREQALNLE